MANNRDKALIDLPKEIFTAAMPQAGISGNQTNVMMGILSNSCKHFYLLFKEDLVKRKLFQTVIQAVIDDDRDTVQSILNSSPDLLLFDPKNFIIESKLTWQKFYAEKIAIVAAKRRQVKMFELIFSYYDNLKQTDEVKQAKIQAISAWKIYETKKNAQGKDEIVIPSEYTDYAKLLIEVFSKEMFPNGMYGYGMLSEETELVLSTLFKRLLPEQAVKLDDYLDVELVLLAMYKAYQDHFYTFKGKDWQQRDAFCIRVIGLIQSVQTPETAKILCESLEDMVTVIKEGQKQEITKEAMSYKMKSGMPFYRLSRDSKKGVGFNSYCGIFGHELTMCIVFDYISRFFGNFEYLCRTKTSSLENYFIATPQIRK